MELEPEPAGEFRVNGYTVWHGREGAPEVGILCGRTAQGKRAWAQTRRDAHELMAAMESEEFVGRSGRISGRADGVNLVDFD